MDVALVVREAGGDADRADRRIAAGGEAFGGEIVAEQRETLRGPRGVETEGGLRCARIAEAAAAQSDPGARSLGFDDPVRNDVAVAPADVERDGAATVAHSARSVNRRERHAVAVAKRGELREKHRGEAL